MTSGIAVYPVGDRAALCYHSLAGTPRLVEFASPQNRDGFVRDFPDGEIRTGDTTLDSIAALTDDAARKELAERNRLYLEHHATAPAFLSLIVAENCNLGCSYCIAGTNMDSAQSARATRMTWATAVVALDWMAPKWEAAPNPVLNFTGGEPLLNWLLVQQTVAYVDRRFPNLDERLTLSINTNATLVTEKIAQFLASHSFVVATSLDGVPEVSDLVRIPKKGNFSVAKRILAGWELLARAGAPIDGFMATFNERNYHALNRSVVDFAADFGCSWVRVDCDVIHLLDRPVAETIDRLWEVFEAGRERGVAVEGFWSTPAKNMLAPDYALEIPFFCGAVSGETISVHPDGRLSACGFSDADLGHVDGGVLDRRLAEHIDLVASHLPGTREFCRGCEIEAACGGGCNIALEEASRSGSDAAVRYNCELYREMTRRLLTTVFDNRGST